MQELLFLNQFLEIFSIVLAPLLVIYAFVAYRGQYESRSLPTLILLALALSLTAVFNVASARCAYATATLSADWCHARLLENLTRVAAMIILLFVLRGYIHSEISLIKKKEWKPRELARKCREYEYRLRATSRKKKK